jgi:hypothetical protein
MKKIKINKLPEGFKRLPDGRIVKSMEKGGQPILNAAPRAAANLEAEKGETVVTDLDNNKVPEHYKIGGKKHSEGGTPLNLPAKSFIFSDHKSMSLKGDELKKFIPGTTKKSMTPAAIASLKKFDLSEENEILKDPNADRMSKATAERNIQSKLTKLGELALVQESKKDFEGGIPEIAMPYLKRNGVSPEQVEMINAEMDRASQMHEMITASYGYNKRYAEGGQPTGSPKPFVANVDNVQAVIDHWTVDAGRGKAPVTAQDFIEVSQKYDIPLDFLLTMAANESYFGVAPRANKTKNIFNWANTTPGDTKSGKEQDKYNKYFDSYRDGMEAAAEGLVRLYKPEDGNWYNLLKDDGFVVQRGNNKVKAGAEYATGTNHEKTLRSVRGTVLKYMGTDEEGIAGGITTEEVPYQGKGDGPIAIEDKGYQGKGDGISTAESAKTKANTVKGDTPKASETPYPGKGDKTIPDLVYTSVELEDIPEEELPFTPIPEKKSSENNTVATQTQDDVVQVDNSITPNPLTDTVEADPNAPFYIQDMIKLGNLAGQRANRYYGYTQRLQPFLADPVFMDPERELQANQEVGASNAQALALQGRGQNLAANLSLMQGKLAANQANTLARYTNGNIGVANQFEDFNTKAMNEYQVFNASQNRQQAIDTATVNQQYDNFVRQRNTDMTNQLANAYTNRATAQKINDMFPQYEIDPATGGLGRFTDWNPETGASPVDAWRKQYLDTMLNQPMTQAQESAQQKQLEAIAKAQGGLKLKLKKEGVCLIIKDYVNL